MVGIYFLLIVALLIIRYLETKSPDQPASKERPWWIPSELKPSRRKKGTHRQ